MRDIIFFIILSQRVSKGNIMKTNWHFTLPRVLLLYLSGFVLGGNITLIVTGTGSALGLVFGIIAMICVAFVVFFSSYQKSE